MPGVIEVIACTTPQGGMPRLRSADFAGGWLVDPALKIARRNNEIVDKNAWSSAAVIAEEKSTIVTFIGNRMGCGAAG